MRDYKYHTFEKTDAAICSAFAKLLVQKKSIKKISIVELCQQVGITRSTFYSHYESLEKVAEDLKNALTSVLIDDLHGLKTMDDVTKHIHKVFDYLRANEKLYTQLMKTEMPLAFIDDLDNIICSEIIDELQARGIKSSQMELDVAFWVDGFTYIITHYFCGDFDMTLDELEKYIAKKAEELIKKVNKK